MTIVVSADLRRLLETRIDSFEKLELVIALRRAPGATMTVQALADALRAPRDVIRRLVVELRAATLVAVTSRGDVQQLPPSAIDQAAIDELANVYATDAVPLVKLLSELAMGKIRNMAVQAFGKKPTIDDD